MGGKSGGMPQVNYAEHLRQQEDMMARQMAMQAQYQREAESRIAAEQERQRNLELARRREAATEQETKLAEQEQQESAVFQEMQGQTTQETTKMTGGYNLAMPTIERPGYEGVDRPL